MDIKTKKIIAIAVCAALLLAVAGLVVWVRKISRSNKKWEHNYRVMQDSVRTLETKYGEVLYERGSLILEKQELEAALGITRKQVREYEKQLGSKIAYISKLETRLSIKDTINIIEVVHDTLNGSFSGSYDDGWLRFDQKFSLANPFNPSFEVSGVSMNVPLKVGLAEDYKIFVTSSNPYFNVTDIEGAVIDKSQFVPKPKRFAISIQAGGGLVYDAVHNRVGAGPYAGVGVSYNIVCF